MKTCVQVPGKALEKPSDCVPHTFVPGANPSKQAAARQFDQAFTKLHKDKYDISVVWQYGTFFGTNNSSFLWIKPKTTLIPSGAVPLLRIELTAFGFTAPLSYHATNLRIHVHNNVCFEFSMWQPLPLFTSGVT